jgi:hypothetical protein
MTKRLSPILVGCTAVAALFLLASKPASAMPAVHYGDTNAGMVQDVGRRYWRKPYAYNYGYRPYRYGYYGRPYYRPYAYGYGYPYWGQPGISFGFAF